MRERRLPIPYERTKRGGRGFSHNAASRPQPQRPNARNAAKFEPGVRFGRAQRAPISSKHFRVGEKVIATPAAAAKDETTRPPATTVADPGGRLERVSAVLDKLGPEDLEIIEPHLAAWIRRGRRLAQRDAALRALAGHFLDRASGRAVAEACARELRRYAASGWRHEQGRPAAGDAKRGLMHRILTLNSGKAIAEDQIRAVLAGLR